MITRILTKRENFLPSGSYVFFSCFKTSYVAAAKTCPCKTSYLPRMCAAALLHCVAVAAKPRIMYCFWHYRFCTVITNAFNYITFSWFSDNFHTRFCEIKYLKVYICSE